MSDRNLIDVTDALPLGGRSITELGLAVAQHLRMFQNVAAAGYPFTIENLEYDRIAGAVIVFYTATGEPVPFVTGAPTTLTGEDLRDLVNEVHRALKDYVSTIGGDSFTERLQYVRSSWESREQAVELIEVRNRAAEAERVRSHPWLCECGKRCKSAGGLATHRRSRVHRARTASIYTRTEDL